MTADTRPRMKIAFLGGGINSAVGYTHFLASRLDGFFDLVAGCFSRDQSTNFATAARLGVEQSRCYESFAKMLEAEADVLDAVCILTPTPDHLGSVLDALKAGLNVICEKALVASAQDADLIRAAVEESGQKLMVTFNYAGYPMVREARAKVAAGHLGRIHHIQCEMPQESFALESANPQPWRRKDYGIPCVSLDLGVHVHHLVHYLTGGVRLRNASALEACNGNVPDVVDSVSVLAKGGDSLIVDLRWGKVFLGHSNGLCFRIYGDLGSLMWEQSSPEILHFSEKTGARNTLERGQPNLLEANKAEYNRFKAGHPAGFVEAFANIYSDFHSIICGAKSDQDTYSVDSALQGLRFLSSVHDSAQRSTEICNP